MYSSPSFYAIENNNLPKFNQSNFKKTQKLKMWESKRGHTCLSFFTWVRRPVISSSKSACIGSIRNWISSEPPTALVLRPSLQTQTSNTTKIYIKIQSETEKKKEIENSAIWKSNPYILTGIKFSNQTPWSISSSAAIRGTSIRIRRHWRIEEEGNPRSKKNGTTTNLYLNLTSSASIVCTILKISRLRKIRWWWCCRRVNPPLVFF